MTADVPPPDAPRSRWWWPVVFVLAVVVLVLGLRQFLVQSFSVPSGSMQPTIEPGDRLLVDRLVRGDGLHRGDIVVFDGTRAFPASGPDGSAGDTDYVKRVIGLPGDHVVCCDASTRLLVNGAPLDEPYLFPGDAASTLTFDVTVPEGSMWVMGDHRSESGDSRSYLGRPGGGMVPLRDVIGQATVRYWPPGRLGSLGSPGSVTSPQAPGAVPPVPSPVGAGQ